jgi:hypothetical protein
MMHIERLSEYPRRPVVVGTPSRIILDRRSQAKPLELVKLRRTVDAERAVDQTLADSFPASDPPSWTLGVARPSPPRRSVDAVGVASASAVSDRPLLGVHGTGIMVVSSAEFRQRTLLQNLTSFASAASLSFLVPVVVLLVGIPVVLAVRMIVEGMTWLMTMLL